MNVLVDTQSIIWFAENNPQLSQNARNAIEALDNECYVSMATFWEVSIKMGLEKLDVKGMSLSDFWDEVIDNNFLILDIRREHILQYEKLPLYHRDPFDRLIISQGIVETMLIVSNDHAFDAYPVTRIW